jgi:hypothetical protein
VEETWTDRELPVLTAIVEAFELNPNGNVRIEQIERLTGLSTDDLARAMAALDRARPRFFDGQRVNGLAYPIIVSEVTERAMVAAEQWPSPESLVADLIAALERAAEHETDPEKKSKLAQTAQTLGGIALQIAIGWASGSLPHP